MIAIIEIPKGDDRRRHIKYDKSGFIDLGPIRETIPVNNGIMPVHYGYIPETLNKIEGDEIDILVLSNKSYAVGEKIEVEPIALLRREDGDDKIVAVDEIMRSIKSWDDIPHTERELIQSFFTYYHKFISFENTDDAIKYVEKGSRQFIMNKTKIILIYGNGNSTVNDHWLQYVKTEFEKHGLEVILKDFPDLPLAREEYWIPFLESLGADENTILIGHSTGAIAAMRYSETHKIFGSVLVATYHTDGGDANEQASGYFDTPWNWETIKENQQWIIQFASTDDPYIPVEEPRFVHDKLNTEYYEYTDQGHMGDDIKKKTFPDLVKAVIEKIK